MFYKDFGWEYVCAFGNYFHVYRSTLESPPEIHTDPKMLADAFLRICYTQALLVLLLFGVLFFTLHSGASNLINIVRLGFPMGLDIIVWAALSAAYAFQLFRLYQTYRRLKSGVQLEHSANYRKYLPLRCFLRIAPVLAVVIFFFTMTIETLSLVNNEKDWVEIPISSPMVSLIEIEQEDTTQMENSFRSKASFRHTFLSPEQYTVQQNAIVSGRKWLHDSQRNYAPGLTLETYQLRFPSLAEPLLHSLIKDSTHYNDCDVETLEGFGAEEAYLYTSIRHPWWRQAFFRAGDTVIYVDYRGESDIRPFLPEFAALAQADFPAEEP